MGALTHISHIFDCSRGDNGRSSSYKFRNRKTLQTVEIKVKMDCEGCVSKVRRAVEGMKGVSEVEIDPIQSKLTVVGHVDPAKVLSRVRHRAGKRADLWPYVTYDVVARTYAPAGCVRSSPIHDPRVSQLARASSSEVRYTTAFSDENPNAACSIM